MSPKKDIGTVVKSAMDGYTDAPDDQIWAGIESGLKRQRRMRLLMLLLLLLGLTITGTIYLMNSDSESSSNENTKNVQPIKTEKTRWTPNDSLSIEKTDKITTIDSTQTDHTSLPIATVKPNTTTITEAPIKPKTSDNQSLQNSDEFSSARIYSHSLFMLDVQRLDPLQLTIDSLQLLSTPTPVEEDEAEESIWRFSPIISLDHYNAFGRNTSKQNTLNYGAYLYFYGSSNLAIRFGFKKVSLQYNFQEGNSAKRQQITYNEIPMEGRYFFNSENALKTSFIIGGSFLFLEKTTLTDFDNNIIRENRGEFTDATFSLNAGLGLHYDVSPKWRLNLESSFRYHLTPYTRNQDFSPYILSLSFGVEYGF